MKLTDQKAIKLLDRANSAELEEHISNMTALDADGMNDLEVLASESNYLLDMYKESGTIQNEEYAYARKRLKRSENGKFIPFSIETFRPLPGYNKNELEEAKKCVEEVNRLKNLVRKLADMGYHG